MSLMSTLARVAAGVMVAKGVGAVMRNQQQGKTGHQTGGGFLGDLLKNNTGSGNNPNSNTARHDNSGGLGGMLGQIFGGGSDQQGRGSRYGGPNSRGAQGGLGGMLDKMTGQMGRARTGSTTGGGLGSILEQIGGGRSSRGSSGSGGLGDLLGGLLGGGAAGAAAGGLASKGAQPANDASFGEVFNDALSKNGEPEVAPTPEQNAIAGLMLRAMIQAAKSDGKIDDNEKERLMGHVGEVDEEERSFIREQMAAPVDAKALARDVPEGLEAQVYLMSLMAIDFDSKAEAQYLHALAEAMGLDQSDVNRIHKEVGVQDLYA